MACDSVLLGKKNLTDNQMRCATTLTKLIYTFNRDSYHFFSEKEEHVIETQFALYPADYANEAIREFPVETILFLITHREIVFFAV